MRRFEAKSRFYIRILIIVLPLYFNSCDFDSLTNPDPTYTLMYSSSFTYDVSCESFLEKTGNLDYIDLRNTDTVNIRFKYSLTNNLSSQFVIYYIEGSTERNIAQFRYSASSGTHYENLYIRNIDLYKDFRYRIFISSTGGNCSFKVSDLRIYKKINN